MNPPHDLLGHTHVIQRLWAALSRDALHHAYLFEGPVGVGKATVALRLAMAANCERPTGEQVPCCSCPTCKQIVAGSHPDVLRLSPSADTATPTISVQAVREVVRRTGYRRYSGRRRFILIDPAEAMQPSAANALLKTLEEPPEGTGFVLIAANAAALLPTIVSRCQRVRLGPVPEPELVAWLTARDLPHPTQLARRSQGCPGRALALANGELERRDLLRSTLLSAIESDLTSIYKSSEKLCSGRKRQDWAVDVSLLIEVAEDLLRDTVVLGSGGTQPLLNSDITPTVEGWVSRLWPTGVPVLEGALRNARHNLRANVSGRTLVDALLTRFREELAA